MLHKLPILLSFYGLSNGTTTLLFGQLTYTTIKDLSFKEYNRRKTFRTLLSLYRTKPYANQDLSLLFDKERIETKTDAHGSFYFKTNANLSAAILRKVVLPTTEEVKMMDGLYPKHVHEIKAPVIVVSDIDDTLLHSHIYRKIQKFRTLMFTTMEKRKTVTNMQELLNLFAAQGADFFYLSNSEQNLYPLIYRFLTHNNFPAGPIFLKKMRRLLDVLLNIKFPLKNIHKQTTLEEMISLFPDRKFILVGDNTQHDLSIYMAAAEKFPLSIKYIIIRKVVEQREDENLIKKYQEKLKPGGVTLYYADHFPDTFSV